MTDKSAGCVGGGALTSQRMYGYNRGVIGPSGSVRCPVPLIWFEGHGQFSELPEHLGF